MFGYISTKDLYLITLRRIKRFSYSGDIKVTYFDNEVYYAIAKKSGDVFIKYYDIFSGSEYKHWKDISEPGMVGVHDEKPILTITNKVKISDLQRLLIKNNNVCYDEKKIKKLTKEKE